MTTGLIYAALFYLASLVLGGIFGFAYYGQDPQAMVVVGFFAKFVGLFMAPIGFVLGFFKEKRKERAEQARLQHDREVADARIREQLRQTATVRPISQPESIGVGKHSDEVEEYLHQTSAIDLKGIADFVKETRRHNLDELKEGS